jgi:hypothetical protein
MRLQFGLGYQHNRYRMILSEGTAAKASSGAGFTMSGRYALRFPHKIWIGTGFIFSSFKGNFYSEKREPYGANWHSVEFKRGLLSIPITVSVPMLKDKLEVGAGVQFDALLSNSVLVRENTFYSDSGTWKKRNIIHETDDMELNNTLVAGLVFTVAYRFKTGPVHLVPRYSFYYALDPDFNTYTDFLSTRNLFELSVNIPIRKKE